MRFCFSSGATYGNNTHFNPVVFSWMRSTIYLYIHPLNAIYNIGPYQYISIFISNLAPACARGPHTFIHIYIYRPYKIFLFYFLPPREYKIQTVASKEQSIEEKNCLSDVPFGLLFIQRFQHGILRVAEGKQKKKEIEQ